MDPVISEARQKMLDALGVLAADLATVRTGRSTPALVENVVVGVYGGTQKLRIMELATIATPDSHTLVLTPYDASVVDEIQKGIIAANIGLSPSSDGKIIRISIPPLSEERRVELIKLMKQKLENGRIMIRQARQDARNIIRKKHLNKEISEEELQRFEKEIQKITDDIIAQVDEMGRRKEEELMQI